MIMDKKEEARINKSLLEKAKEKGERFMRNCTVEDSVLELSPNMEEALILAGKGVISREWNSHYTVINALDKRGLVVCTVRGEYKITEHGKNFLDLLNQAHAIGLKRKLFRGQYGVFFEPWNGQWPVSPYWKFGAEEVNYDVSKPLIEQLDCIFEGP
jgi:hypothetical protein